jgi:hypothetical protein
MRTTQRTKDWIITGIVAVVVISVFIIANIVFGAGTGTSGKTVSDITTDVRRQFNEYTAVFLDDTSDIVDWINYATYDIVSKTHCLQNTMAIPLASGTTEYLWSGVSDYITIKGVIYDSTNGIKSLLKTDLQSIGYTPNTGPPQYWYEWNSRLGVYPTPDPSRSGHSIYVYYVPQTVEYVTGTSDVVTPAIYDNSIVNYIMYKALMKDKKYQEAGNYLTEYNNTLQQYRVDLVDKPKEPRQVVNQ